MNRFRYLPVLLIVALAAFLAAGCGSGKKTVPTSAVATCGDQTIQKSQFDRLLNQARTSYKNQKRPFPKAGSADYNTLRGQAMQFLVRRSEFDQKADELGVKVSDSDVEARLKKIKKQYFGGDEKKYQKQLKQQGLSEDQVRDDIKASLVQERIYNKVTKDAKVSSKDVEDHYKKNRKQYVQPASRDVRHILVKKKALANQIYQQLSNGANFATLAKRYSQDTSSKKQGGKLTISKGGTVPEFDKLAFSLKVNEISKPVKTQYGWHVIQAVSAVKKQKVTPFAQVKDSIRQQLLQEKKQKAMNEWTKDVEKEFKSKCTYQIGYAPPATGTTGTTTK